jgi:hypothetical protein
MPRPDHGPAILAGQLRYTSVTATCLADPAVGGCPKAWWYHYGPLRLTKKTGRGADLGVAGHARLEHYLTTGNNVLARTELVGLAALPTPSPILLVEWPLTNYLKARGVPMVGYVDCVDLAAEVISDWKFKADLDKWSAKKEDLTSPLSPYGVQMLAYVVAVSAAFGGRVWTVRHLNFRHSGRYEYNETKTSISSEEAINKWGSICLRILPLLEKLAQKTEAEEHTLPRNEEACGRYGGCPYEQRCKNPMERLRANLARLKKEK